MKEDHLWIALMSEICYKDLFKLLREQQRYHLFSYLEKDEQVLALLVVKDFCLQMLQKCNTKIHLMIRSEHERQAQELGNGRPIQVVPEALTQPMLAELGRCESWHSESWCNKRAFHSEHGFNCVTHLVEIRRDAAVANRSVQNVLREKIEEKTGH